MTDFQTYLAAKRTVDDRALNRRVFDRFSDALCRETGDGPVRIVELGAGVGTMIARLAAWDALPERVSYRAIDRDGDSVAAARDRLPGWLEEAGYSVEWVDSSIGSGTIDRAGTQDRPATLVARSDDRRLDVTLETADAFAIDDSADAVIAAALLDVVPLDEAIEAIGGLLDPGGLLYAPITFDGGTRFAPDDRLDDRIERCYHRHMDEVRREGGSDTGRRLLATLPDRGWAVTAAGGSDWIVRPGANGYPGSERAVVGHLLETIDGALREVPSPDLDREEVDRWLDRRRAELDRGELVFVAHNLDVLARRP